MKYFPLVWASLWRKRPRTLFTLASIMVAFLLFGLLQGINAAFNRVVEQAHVNRLLASDISFLPLPLAYLPRIERLRGVTNVAYATQFVAYYQDPRNAVAPIAVDPALWFAVYSDWKLPRDQLEAFTHTRTGAVLGPELARRYGWRIGDKVPLHSTVVKQDGTADWTVDVVGILEDPDNPGESNTLLMQYGYFDESRLLDKGTVLQYEATIADPKKAAEIAGAIDGTFANSGNQTRTQSEREFAQSMLTRVGDITFFVDAIVGAVFFTLLFLTGNTMMQSLRESIPELAVLKTIGFSDRALVALVLAQSGLVCGLGAALGLGAAAAIFPLAHSFIGGARLSWLVVSAGAGAAVIVALISGLPPAWRAKRLEIVEALVAR
jgi:putative ABC transport system permease protein